VSRAITARCGARRALDYLKAQRGHLPVHPDQTLRLANEGLTSREIAEQLVLPSTLRNRFANRDYYGTVRHNAQAVYQMYFGWIRRQSGEPQSAAAGGRAKKYVAAMGRRGRRAEAGPGCGRRGGLSLAATLLNHLVFGRARRRAGEGTLLASA